MHFIPKDGSSPQVLEVYKEFPNDGGCALTMYNTKEVKRFSKLKKFYNLF
jgi:hypothetical protein